MAYTLEYYKRKKIKVENEIRNIRSKNQNTMQEIERLKEAYDKLGKIKRYNEQSAQQVREKSTLSNIAGDVQWRGRSKKQFDGTVKSDIKREAKTFYNSIDDIQDEIGRALDQKRGELNSGSITLNSLNKLNYKIYGIIRNWIN